MESPRIGSIGSPSPNQSNTSSSNNNNNSMKISSNNDPHHIASVHNKTPIRVTTSKSLQDIAKNTPVLQRILPSQVEIVYHRKSGENELKRSKSSRKTSKTVKQRDATEPTSELNESLNNQSAQVLDDSSFSILQSSSHEQSITTTTTSTNDKEPHTSADNTDAYLKINNISTEVQNLQTRFDDSSSLLLNATTSTTCSNSSKSNQYGITANKNTTGATIHKHEKEVQVQIGQEKESVEKPVMEEKCVQTEEDGGCSEGCLEIVTILNESIEDMKLQIFNLNTRVNNLEATMKTEVEDLRHQRQKRLKSARGIAEDMKKMTNVVNSLEWLELEKNVAQLLHRVKNPPAIVKKCPSLQVKQGLKIIHDANHKNLSQQETFTNNNNNNNSQKPIPIKS